VYQTDFRLPDEELFYHASAKLIDPDKPTIVFLHGLGETGYCFAEAFRAPELAGANLIAPDLIGFGHATPAADGDYAFARQIERLTTVLDAIGIDRFSLVGHSMGGDLATLMCDQDQTGRIAHLVNIEGNLTEKDQFLTNLVLENEARFPDWCPEGIVAAVIGHDTRPSIQRYVEALHLSQPEAILATAREIATHNVPLGEQGDAMGRRFASLKLPKMYCHGDTFPDKSRAFLEQSGSDFVRFSASGHWVMIDRADVFYPTLAAFVGLTDSHRRHAS